MSKETRGTRLWRETQFVVGKASPSDPTFTLHLVEGGVSACMSHDQRGAICPLDWDEARQLRDWLSNLLGEGGSE